MGSQVVVVFIDSFMVDVTYVRDVEVENNIRIIFITPAVIISGNEKVRTVNKRNALSSVCIKY
jgi:hypothetical protein